MSGFSKSGAYTLMSLLSEQNEFRSGIYGLEGFVTLWLLNADQTGLLSQGGKEVRRSLASPLAQQFSTCGLESLWGRLSDILGVRYLY